MSVPRVVSASTRCEVSGEHFQGVKLEDGTYVLIKGEVAVILRQPLSNNPGEKGSIDHYDDLAALSAAWEDLVGTFAGSGDYASSARLDATWDAWVETVGNS